VGREGGGEGKGSGSVNDAWMKRREMRYETRRGL
jgi:hypothetical protein